MAWSNLGTKTDAVDTYAAADINQLMENCRVISGNGTSAPTDDCTGLDTRLSAIEALTTGTVATKTADYVVLDNDGYGTIICNPSAGNMTITLPTAAANTNRMLRILVSHVGGTVTIDGEGAETIEAGSNSLTTVQLQNKGDKLVIICNGTSWYAIELCTTLDTGWIGRSDWTNVHLGCVNVTYDNLTGTFTTGERVNEYSDSGCTTATGQYGYVISNSGTVLVLKNVAGTGNFANDKYLKGVTSAATAQVNGATKDTNGNLLHNFGVSVSELKLTQMISSDKTEANIICIASHCSVEGVNVIGVQSMGVDTNTVKIQTGAVGILIMDDSGSNIYVDSEDWYFRIIAKLVI